MSEKRFTTELDSNYAGVGLILLLFAVVGVMWLSLTKVEAGITYGQIFLLASFLILMIIIFVKEVGIKGNKPRLWFPFHSEAKKSAISFYFGIVVAILLVFSLAIYGKFNDNNYSIQNNVASKSLTPLTISKVTDQSQLFSVLSIVKDKFFSVFIIIFTASPVEEFVLGVIFTMAFMLAFWALLVSVMGFKQSSGLLLVIFMLGNLASVGFFTKLHELNDTYKDKKDFFSAAVFRFVLNTLVFLFGMSMEFGIGFHMTINMFALGALKSLGIMVTTLAGIFYLLLLLAFFIPVIRSTKSEIIDTITPRYIPSEIGG